MVSGEDGLLYFLDIMKDCLVHPRHWPRQKITNTLYLNPGLAICNLSEVTCCGEMEKVNLGKSSQCVSIICPVLRGQIQKTTKHFLTRALNGGIFAFSHHLGERGADLQQNLPRAWVGWVNDDIGCFDKEKRTSETSVVSRSFEARKYTYHFRVGKVTCYHGASHIGEHISAARSVLDNGAISGGYVINENNQGSTRWCLMEYTIHSCASCKDRLSSKQAVNQWLSITAYSVGEVCMCFLSIGYCQSGSASTSIWRSKV